MKTKFIQIFWTLIFSVLIVLLIVLYLNSALKLETFGAAIAGLITIYISFQQQTIANDAIFRELFISFNSRYSNKLNDLLNKLRIEPSLYLDTEQKLLIIDYFNLCSEEYLWYTKGRIPSKVWNAWLEGIKVNLSIKKVYDLFEEETDTKEKKVSYYGFAEYIVRELEKSTTNRRQNNNEATDINKKK